MLEQGVRMRISRLVGVAAACLAITAASACSSDPSSDAGADADAAFGECELTGEPGEYELETVEPDVLTIKADVPSVGWWDGNTVEDIKSGYEYCMAAEIAHRSGLKSVDLQYVSFDALVSGQLTGYDLSLDEISITAEREEVVDFSDPYYTTSIGVLAKKGADVTESNLAGLRLGVKQGTAAQQWVQDTLNPQNLDVFPGDSEALAAVAAGRIDAYLQDVAIQLGQAKQSGGQVEVVGQFPTDEAYGAMLPEGSPNTATINEIIADLKADGTLDMLSETYLGPAFGGDPEAVPVWSTP
jgi:polar amino acid transport system substrate-binding protein